MHSEYHGRDPAPSTNFLSLAGLTGTGLLFPIDVMAIYASSSITSGPVTYRPWPWYFRYNYFSGLTGHPTTYSLLQNANGGTLLFDPEPSVTVTLQLELIWFPIDLVDDSTPEFIPVPWQDCVKFYAAYLAYSNSQRTADADGMMGKFQTYLARARRMTKPTQLPGYSNQDWSQQSPPGAPPRAQ